MSANTELVERLARAFENEDTDAAMACLDPEVELLPIRAQLDRTSYFGHDGYRQVVTDFAADWEGLRLVQEELHGAADRVVAVGRLRAKGKTSGVDLDVPLALLYDIRDGLVTRIQSFSDPDEALRAAAIES
jgi:uncharacterized protein